MVHYIRYLTSPLLLGGLSIVLTILSTWLLVRWLRGRNKAKPVNPALQVTSLKPISSPQVQPVSHVPPSATVTPAEEIEPQYSTEETFAKAFWTYSADCIINKCKKHQYTLKVMRERDPENLTILQKWAARDLFTYVPFRTPTQMMYTLDGTLVSERPDGFPCPQITDIIPMLSKSQQYLCGIIFHLSEKKYYTMDPTHQYHGDHATGYFYDNLGQNIQDEFEEQLRLISEISDIDLSTFTHIEVSPLTPLAFTDYAICNFLCRGMCLALSYEFEDRTLNPTPEDFGMLLANTWTNSKESAHSRTITLHQANTGHSSLQSPTAEDKKVDESDPRSVTFTGQDEFCYIPSRKDRH